MQSISNPGNSPAYTSRLEGQSTIAAEQTPTSTSLQGHLNALIQYAERHLPSGKVRSDALVALRHYAGKHLEANPKTGVSPIEMAAHQALGEFAQALSNSMLSKFHKIRSITHLAQGLGVCTEGECLNILDATRSLVGSEAGLKNRWNEYRHQLIEQSLLALVQQESLRTRSAHLAKKLEIHDVQSLKNLLAAEWGLQAQQDRHASAAFCKQAGDMARELLRLTVTPQAIAQGLRMQLTGMIEHSLGSQVNTGLPSNVLQGDSLQRLIGTEFGDDINLHALLEFSDDYSTVKLKPAADIEAHLMSLMAKHLTLDHPETGDQYTSRPTVEEALKQVEHLRVELTTPRFHHAAALYTLGIHWGFTPNWIVANGLLNDPTKRKDEQVVRDSIPSLGHDFQRFGVEIPVNQNHHHQGAKGDQ